MGWPRSAWVKRVGGVLAVVLLALAIVIAVRGVDVDAVRRASAGELALLAGLVAINLLAGGLLFWAVTRTFDADPPVSVVRMTELVAASSLLNYVPVVRAGLVGRAAYLRARHNLPLTQSVLSLVVIAAVAGAVAGASLLVLLGGALGWGAFAASIVALTLATPLAERLLHRPTRCWALWAPLRVVDVLVAGARLWLAFRIVGEPIGFEAAFLAGSAALVVKLVGLTPNGLGLSEWAVAGLASVLSPASAAAGAAAALIDRGVEVIVVAITGTIAMWRLRDD